MSNTSSLFGSRWSLYFVKNSNEIAYAMHEDSPLRILGYVMKYYADGSEPVAPWSLHLNCNRKHQEIRLDASHFSRDGKNITHALLLLVAAIDPDWRVGGSEPVFEDTVAKKRLPLTSAVSEAAHADSHVGSTSSLEGPTFGSVMNRIFGRVE